MKNHMTSQNMYYGLLTLAGLVLFGAGMYLLFQPKMAETNSSQDVSYKYFAELCRSIQSTEQQIQGNENSIQFGTDLTKIDEAKAKRVLLQQQRLNLVRMYNENADAQFEKMTFLGDKLPRRIDPEGGITQCE